VSIEATVDLIFLLPVTYNVSISNHRGFPFYQIETDTEGVKLMNRYLYLRFVEMKVDPGNLFPVLLPTGGIPVA
jgi:hypothetical protein